MEVRFLGPLGKVTGSCTWMRDTARNWNFLVDCGMQQGELTAMQWNQCDWPFVPADLKFVVLTHAHIDHCGLLPALYKQGFEGTVYCTGETRDLAIILLKDAAGFPDAIFTKADVDRIKWHEPGKPPLLGGWHPVDNDLMLRFFRSGHVMGSVSVSIHWGPIGSQQSIAFSGDLGPSYENAEHLPFLRFNMHPDPCDFAVIESTYGGVNRSDDDQNAETRRDKLRALIERTIEQRGTLMIPAFSLGRTQDVLFDLHWIVAENPAKFETVNFLFDSPAASRMHPIILKGLSRSETNGRHGKVRPLWLGKQLFRWLELDDKDPAHIRRALEIISATLGCNYKKDAGISGLGNEVAQAWTPIMRSVENRSEMLKHGTDGPSVVVVSSGACDGGPASFWLPRLLGSEANTVALTGYCSPSSIGGQLIDLQNVPIPDLARCSGELEWSAKNSFAKSDVRASVEILTGYSAHADQTALLNWLFKPYPNELKVAGHTVFIQHGTDNNRRALKDRAIQRAQDSGKRVSVISPDCPLQWFDLDRGGQAIDKEQKRRQLLDDHERIRRELEALEV